MNRFLLLQLKTESSYYPNVLIKYYGSECYASTLVRIKRNGTWYLVHCVESIILTESIKEEDLLIKFIDSVYKIQFLYNIIEVNDRTIEQFQDVDKLQISEEERLMILYNNIKP